MNCIKVLFPNERSVFTKQEAAHLTRACNGQTQAVTSDLLPCCHTTEQNQCCSATPGDSKHISSRLTRTRTCLSGLASKYDLSRRNKQQLHMMTRLIRFLYLHLFWFYLKKADTSLHRESHKNKQIVDWFVFAFEAQI